MDARTKQLKAIFDEILGPLDFSLKNNTWRRALAEVVHIIKLEKARHWNAAFNLSCGVHVSIIEPEIAFEKTKPHIVWIDDKFFSPFSWPSPPPPLKRMSNEDRIELHDSLNMELDLTPEYRTQRIQAVLRTYVLPCLEAHSTSEAVRECLKHRYSSSWPACSAMPEYVEKILSSS